jgi:antitoxin HigA-1
VAMCGRDFGTTPRFWLNLQAQYDLDIEADRLGDRLDREVTAHAGVMSSRRSLD